ncbi:MAG: WYL domain-containing transcriptional regulator [Marinagarivorans sp.]
MATEVDTKKEIFSYRMAEILLKLFRGERFSRMELAEQYGVTERTIYRDLNRLGDMTELRPDGQYQLAHHLNGKLSASDLEYFAHAVGVEALFPAKENNYLISLIDKFRSNTFLIKPCVFESAPAENTSFQKLEKSIRQQFRCRLVYKNKQRTLEPYRLINHRGIWYLAATEANHLKSFTLGKIEDLELLDERFDTDPLIQARIDTEDNIWYSAEKFRVDLSVSPDIAYYFQRRAVLPQQQILETDSSGWITVRCHISHPNQILPIIQYWLPNIKIISPLFLHQQLHEQLSTYQKNNPLG